MGFVQIAVAAAVLLMLWDCIEIGRNDAANLLNAVFGARVLRRRTAVVLAGAAVVLGATFSTAVVETARRGIFEPTHLTLSAAMTVYLTAYIIDTVLLYSYSAFGMPVSTTVTLVFALMGAALGVAGDLSIIHWSKIGEVMATIVISIFLTGLAAFFFQRIFRAALRNRTEDPMEVYLHGPWIAGLLLTWLSWFMLTKGFKGWAAASALCSVTIDAYGVVLPLLALWGLLTLMVHVVLTVTRERGVYWLFRVTTVLGMLCMSFAFGQNDLANAASPGLSVLMLWQNAARGVEAATAIPLPPWALLGCGLLMALGMATPSAQRVTRAAVNTGSQFDRIALYAPRWCRAIARYFIGRPEGASPLAPPPSFDARGKRVHFDPLRASVIMSISAGVIAFASSRGMPVSTTYVAFAAIISTGMADRVMSYGDADLKIGRAIWVVFSWFAGAGLAMAAAALTAFVIVRLGTIGLLAMIAGNLTLRAWVARRADRHERIYHEELSRRLREGGANPAAYPMD